LIAGDTGQVVGMEALVRWKPAHEKQLVPPDLFIPVLEETGMIVDVGRWILKTACRQYMEWRHQGMPPLRLSVNISACQFASGSLADDVENILMRTGMEPSCLCLELTEGIVMSNMQQTLEILHQLHALGVALSLDDFGTGFSSLSYLRQMPLHELKIDRSFVEQLPHDANSVAIIDSILGMAHSLNLAIVAEGVESEEHAAFLRDRKCEILQGYHFSRPLATDAFLEMVEACEQPCSLK
jgi:EAL domain-containing protein (putative c-di-GMP-specific phosphodiesterase class I)